MSMRETEEWLGKSDSTPVPTRVRIRQYIRDNGVCQCGCTTKIQVGDKWETDHTIAIANGGENRESNLRTLLSFHHKLKTKADVAEKSTTARVRAKHLGLKKPRKITRWRRFDGSIREAGRER
jgi:5-methylcytosine-specific restriction endonuclease McrA